MILKNILVQIQILKICRNMYKYEVKIFSKNKEEMKVKLSANKYNL